MPTRIRPIEVPRTVHMADYHEIEGAQHDVDECRRLGTSVARALGTRRVFMLSSTAKGGGVAEMMPRICALLDDVGVDARWLVLETDERGFFDATKRLHNRLHGEDDHASLDAGVYERVSREAAEALRMILEDGDVLVVHDPQPLGAGALVAPMLDGALLWRCHIGVPFENGATRSAWEFLAPWLTAYPRALFSSERYAPPSLADRAVVLHPSIDPRDHKNRELRPAKLMGVLASAGFIEAPARPTWARFEQKAVRLGREGWIEAAIPDLLFAPAIVQVSRFDRLKGLPFALRAFVRLVEEGPTWARNARIAAERALDELARVQLILAGPDPDGVADDPEAVAVLQELRSAWASLPAALASRVHLVKLPMADAKQNALMVNALQRVAAVVVQPSLQEGFGLTVTEALWKAVPVVASDVGGISLQLRPGVDGLLVQEPRDTDELAHSIFNQLVLGGRAEAMAHCGRRRVAQHFLVVRQVRRWLEELAGLVERRDLTSRPSERAMHA